jgi:hypothetical protein
LSMGGGLRRAAFGASDGGGVRYDADGGVI